MITSINTANSVISPGAVSANMLSPTRSLSARQPPTADSPNGTRANDSTRMKKLCTNSVVAAATSPPAAPKMTKTVVTAAITAFSGSPETAWMVVAVPLIIVPSQSMNRYSAKKV